MDLAGKSIETLNGPAEGSRCLLQAHGERRPPTASDLAVKCLVMLDYSILHGRRAGASTRHGSVESCTGCPHDRTSGLFWTNGYIVCLASYKPADGMEAKKAAPIHSFASFSLPADGSHPGHSSHLRLSTKCIEQRVARHIRVRHPVPVCKFTLFVGCWSPASIFRPEPDPQFVEFQWQCALALAKIQTRPLVMVMCTLRCTMRLHLGPNITSVEV
ncbi:uncharacterized protein BO88DRAFT_445959 [Aspergillus vadensis CBS 113365]|uniref:Uncharacterized protein n=1 Tax=Aspergillus vadensis (strain CBS 113365 / IMI 142717 / IBT 24658) TaxID=1448311 RepID=A0A319B2B5_ASPVC|nr:hypothetical protein BO88DRAFT_445959 [Aspergillus vadensis CBS 113365]PYH65974.1 hypothetical protein BO88DRAFT_445959 [Aspergillus vadensis CBS 113365]